MNVHRNAVTKSSLNKNVNPYKACIYGLCRDFFCWRWVRFGYKILLQKWRAFHVDNDDSFMLFSILRISVFNFVAIDFT